jgi:uncharacterized protein YjgD (DUF1641 family)
VRPTAKPITTIERAPATETASIEAAPQALANAEFQRLLVLAHERGILQGLNHLLEEPDAALGTATDWATQPGNLAVVRHALLFYNTLQSIDPRAVQVLLNRLDGAAAAATQRPDEDRVLGLWGLLRALRDPDVNRGMRFLLRMAAGLGRAVGKLEK